MRLPNLNTLRSFDAAARHLNFRLAADELHVTQGAVAQQVRGLEADLGQKLFTRKARGLALTEIGRRYHGAIRRAMALIEDATRELVPQATRVTLSLTPSFASKWLVPRLSDFADAHPDIDLQTVATEGLANFKTDGVDLAVRQGDGRHQDGLHIEQLFKDDLCAVCSPGFAARLGASDDIASFADQPFLQDGHTHWARLFDEAGVQATGRMMQFNQTALAIDAAANGQGLTLAQRLLVQDDLNSGRLVAVWQDQRKASGGFNLVWPKGSKSFARDSVINWILEQAKS